MRYHVLGERRYEMIGRGQRTCTSGLVLARVIVSGRFDYFSNCVEVKASHVTQRHSWERHTA